MRRRIGNYKPWNADSAWTQEQQDLMDLDIAAAEMQKIVEGQPDIMDSPKGPRFSDAIYRASLGGVLRGRNPFAP